VRENLIQFVDKRADDRLRDCSMDFIKDSCKKKAVTSAPIFHLWNITQHTAYAQPPFTSHANKSGLSKSLC